MPPPRAAAPHRPPTPRRPRLPPPRRDVGRASAAASLMPSPTNATAPRLGEPAHDLLLLVGQHLGAHLVDAERSGHGFAGRARVAAHDRGSARRARMPRSLRPPPRAPRPPAHAAEQCPVGRDPHDARRRARGFVRPRRAEPGSPHPPPRAIARCPPAPLAADVAHDPAPGLRSTRSAARRSRGACRRGCEMPRRPGAGRRPRPPRQERASGSGVLGESCRQHARSTGARRERAGLVERYHRDRARTLQRRASAQQQAVSRASPIAFATARGVASPRAHGHETTSTATARSTATGSAHARSRVKTKPSRRHRDTTGTNTPATASARRWACDLAKAASSTSAASRPARVSAPVRATRTRNSPVRLMRAGPHLVAGADLGRQRLACESRLVHSPLAREHDAVDGTRSPARTSTRSQPGATRERHALGFGRRRRREQPRVSSADRRARRAPGRAARPMPRASGPTSTMVVIIAADSKYVGAAEVAVATRCTAMPTRYRAPRACPWSLGGPAPPATRPPGTAAAVEQHHQRERRR